MSRNTVKSYQTMRTVLRLVESNPGITLSEIADSLDVSKSTVHRHLATLSQHGFVTKRDGGYQLGLGLLDLGEKARQQRSICEIAKPKLEEIARETGENIWLSVEEDGDIVYLYRVSGKHHIATYASVGHRTKPHLLAAGKVILAHMDQQRADEIIADLDMSSRTNQSVTDEAELRRQIEQARERGVAYNYQEAADDIHAIAAPIFRPEGGVYGAISLFGPANRLTKQKLKTEYKELALQVAEEIKLRAEYG